MAKRLTTQSASVGSVKLGSSSPVVPQTMTTTDTMDTEGTVAQVIRCHQAGAQIVRITAPSKNEAENLKNIKEELQAINLDVPLVADIHFTPHAAEIAAQHVDKVRINPGNYADKKRFEQKEYTDEAYQQEIQRIRTRFIPLLELCKEKNRAIRIGTNHGSLSDRIMSHYGDTALGMVESAMEFLRIAREQQFHNIVLSMKSSNPMVMVESYRLLVAQMLEEFSQCYPLHLGVTEAGDGMDGRVKSALGIGTLMDDGIGDTIRVSLTEEPEMEIPVCQALIDFYAQSSPEEVDYTDPAYLSPQPRTSTSLSYSGGDMPSQVMIRSRVESMEDLQKLGHRYDPDTDKWHSEDTSADLVWVDKFPSLASYPENLWWVVEHPDVSLGGHQIMLQSLEKGDFRPNTLIVADFAVWEEKLASVSFPDTSAFIVELSSEISLADIRRFKTKLAQEGLQQPIFWYYPSTESAEEQKIIAFTRALGSPFVEGIGDGVVVDMEQAENLSLAFSILQATRSRISKTEYISCPSCGRTLFDLQETTQKVREATSHLKGLKIAVMGCIVNGPGEMADADYGYVGVGPDKISLYKGQEVLRKNVPSAQAVDELIELLKEQGVWIEPSQI